MSTISTSELNAKLNVAVTSDLIKQLGFTPVARPDGRGFRGVYWDTSQVAEISRAVGQYMMDRAPELEQEADDEL